MLQLSCNSDFMLTLQESRSIHDSVYIPKIKFISYIFSCLQTAEEEFDTTIPGPWMKKWELVHTNKHTDAYFAQQTHSV